MSGNHLAMAQNNNQVDAQGESLVEQLQNLNIPSGVRQVDELQALQIPSDQAAQEAGSNAAEQPEAAQLAQLELPKN